MREGLRQEEGGSKEDGGRVLTFKKGCGATGVEIEGGYDWYWVARGG